MTPLRALSQDIQKAMQEVCYAMDLPWQVAVRNGDTDAKTRAATQAETTGSIDHYSRDPTYPDCSKGS